MSLTISGIIGLIISQIVGDQVDSEQIANFIDVGGLIVFGLLAWYGRVRAGGITWYGAKK